MGLRIRTNVSSLKAQRHLQQSTKDLEHSSVALSSGHRINEAADDAAGLAISENLRAEVRSLAQARRNANDGISLLQVAEGGLNETANMLIRLRELAIQAASDTISDRERGFADREFLALKNEIDRIAGTTEFNGTLLLNGTNEVSEDFRQPVFPMEVQVGSNYFEEADGLDTANPVNIVRINLQRLNGFTHGDNSLDLGENTDGARISSKGGAQESIQKLDDALNKVNDHRAYIGALQQRFQTTITTIGNRIENMESARSRIRDTDYAAETAKYTQSKIIQQAGASILAQANQQPALAQSLLQAT